MPDAVLHALPGRSRHYARTDRGVVVPSVTTIVGLTPKPYLLNWVVKLAAEWAADNAEALAQMDWLERVETIKRETRVLREEGAKRGTALHEFAELYLWAGVFEPGSLNNATAGVVAILERLQPEVLYTEAVVWNGDVGYAGTVDGVWRVCTAEGYETWLIDWKSSKSRSAEWAIQLEAYKRAETIFAPDGTEHLMPYIDKTVVLWTPYEGPCGILPVLTTNSEWEAFIAAARVLHWTRVRGVKEVFGPLAVTDLQQENINRNENGHD